MTFVAGYVSTVTSSNDAHPGIGELQRSLQAVLVRFEALATKMDTQFVQKENFNVWQRLFDETIHGIRDTLKAIDKANDQHATKEELVERYSRLHQEIDKRAYKSLVDDLRQDVAELQDDKKWLIRLVGGVIVLAVLTLVVAQNMGGGL